MLSLGEVLNNSDDTCRVENKTEVVLKSVEQTTVKTPTKDLIKVPAGLSDVRDIIYESGFLIYDTYTLETWNAPNRSSLDENFVYKLDIEVYMYSTKEAANRWHSERGALVNPGYTTCKSCYILNNPGNETYEAYYDSDYPSRKYGQSTPRGCLIHKYRNRFQRDIAILQLDKLYNNSSAKDATELISKQLKPNQAIVVSDGAYINDSITSAFFYIDNDSVVKLVEGTLPSSVSQSVLISEINGAYRALEMCKLRGKTDIVYYYDNTAIVNVLRNNKLEYIEEVRRYKNLCSDLLMTGADVKFVEIHPKTGEDREKENKALMFLHNTCDYECKVMSDIYKKNYKVNATLGNRSGTSLQKEVTVCYNKR